MNMRAVLLSTLVAFLSPLAMAARESAPGALIFAVSEGSAGGDAAAAAAEQKYAGLTALIAKALNRPVTFEYVREFAKLEAGIKNRQFDIVMARPSDYQARGIRDHGYRFVATAEPAGHCALIVPKTSPLKSVKELKDKYVILPEKQAYMTNFCLAALRDEGIQVDESYVYFVRDQDAVFFALDRGMAAVGGVASYSGVYRRWLKAGHRVLYESRPQPYLPIIAAPSIDQPSVAKFQELLTTLGSKEDGQAELTRIGVTGFVTSEEKRLLQILDWMYPRGKAAPRL